MKRHFPNWIRAYIDWTSPMEPPASMRVWAAVSAIAGALERKVWVEEEFYRFYPNFYIFFVAPPAVVAKSTTAGVAMNLLREVPGVTFGPDVVTWQSLVTSFVDCAQEFPYNGEYHPMSAMTLEASELGTFLNTEDREMVDLLVQLWDGKQGVFKKETKTSGKDHIANPWINLIGCTTPAWIAENFPAYMIGGGFTSRSIFVFADKKEKLVARPSKHVAPNHHEVKAKLIEDLTKIHSLMGEYKLTPEADAWEEEWYIRHNKALEGSSEDDWFRNVMGRKQAAINKLAMVLAAAEGDEMVLEMRHLGLAYNMLTELEPRMAQTFSKLGRTSDSAHAEQLLRLVEREGKVLYSSAYFQVHKYFPKERDFEAVVAGLIRSGQILLVQEGATPYLVSRQEGEAA